MKFLVSLLLTALLAYVSGLYLPWWSIAIVAFVVGLLVHQKPGKAFLAGFLGVFILWSGLAFYIDSKNNSYLSEKVASLLPLGGNAILLILVTGIVGGLVAGLATLSGSYLRAGKR